MHMEILNNGGENVKYSEENLKMENLVMNLITTVLNFKFHWSYISLTSSNYKKRKRKRGK